MSNELISKDEITNELVNEIKDLIINARNKVAQQVNETLVNTYWNIGNVHYYVDMVFYNKILKTYVLIDLKMGNLKPENFGQMNMYLNYYEEEINDEGDNKPIGIILCADKDNVVAEYSIGGMNNNLFASNYTYYIPNQEELIAQVEQVIRENEEEKNKDNN